MNKRMSLGDFRTATKDLQDDTEIQVQDTGLVLQGVPVRHVQVITHEAGIISKEAFTQVWVWVD